MAQVIAPHPRGLPSVRFLEDEEAFLRETGLSEEEAALEMRQAFQQLQQLSESFGGRRAALEDKLPETEKNLAMVRHLRRQQEGDKDTVAQFELIGGVYAKARVPPSGRVALWLGANVMLEYSLDEAETFLAQSVAQTQRLLSECIDDLRHLEDQRNTLEVNINRMHNHAMQRRRLKQQQQQ